MLGLPGHLLISSCTGERSSEPGSWRKVAVFRALQLGDLLCATPALRALRGALPSAEIVLIGLPWARALVDRLPSVDRLLSFPGFPGLPESAPQLARLPDFLRQAQDERFDAVLQMHGSGHLTNPLTACFAARRQVAFHAAGNWRPDEGLAVEWPEYGHEIERCLRLTDALGVPRAGTALDFPLDDDARGWARDALGDADYACIHPGARLPSRRWPIERFARVADALAGRGLRIVLTGGPEERPLCDGVAAAMLSPGLNLAGATSLWQLGALLERTRILVSNDTGISHVAAAVRAPSVVVCCGADPARWAPLDSALHRVLAHPVDCRPCMHDRCPFGHECALGVSAADVLDEVQELLAVQEVRR